MLIIKPRKGASPIDFVALWEFRDLLVAFATRDLRLRYRQTALGAIWVILQPLLGASLFSIVFGVIAKIPSHGIPYFLISYAGLLGWSLFFGMFTRSSPSLIGSANLIRKVYFPRLLILLGIIPTVLIDFLVAAALLLILMPVYKIIPSWEIILIPLYICIILASALGLGMIASSLAVRYRDIQHIVPFVAQLAMYASPVGYSTSAVPAQYQTLYLLNPLAAPIEMIRASVLRTPGVSYTYVLYSAVASALILLVGLWVFRKFEKDFADVV